MFNKISFGMIITCFFRAVCSLGTPGIPKLFLLCIALSAAALAIIAVAFFSALNAFFLQNIFQAHSAVASAAEMVIAIVAAGFLFPLFLPIMAGFFDDRVAELIERREYPGRKETQAHSFWHELQQDIKFSLWAVFLNIVCLPFYLLPGINIIFFYALNAYLLGRQFFVMAASRHILRKDAEKLRQAYRLPVFLAGLLIVLSATLPVLNILAPFWGVALMVHLFNTMPAQAFPQHLPPPPNNLFPPRT